MYGLPEGQNGQGGVKWIKMERIGEMTISKTLKEINFGVKNPYHGEQPKDKAELAALGVLSDLTDRRGIKHELNMCDDNIKKEIVLSLASIIREVYNDDHTRSDNPDQ